MSGKKDGMSAFNLTRFLFHLKRPAGFFVPSGNNMIASAVPQMLIADIQLVVIFVTITDRSISLTWVSGFENRLVREGGGLEYVFRGPFVELCASFQNMRMFWQEGAVMLGGCYRRGWRVAACRAATEAGGKAGEGAVKMSLSRLLIMAG